MLKQIKGSGLLLRIKRTAAAFTYQSGWGPNYLRLKLQSRFVHPLARLCAYHTPPVYIPFSTFPPFACLSAARCPLTYDAGALGHYRVCKAAEFSKRTTHTAGRLCNSMCPLWPPQRISLSVDGSVGST